MAVTIDPLKTGTSDEVNPTFTTLTVSGAATIGGGLAVTGSISATDFIAGAEQTAPAAPAANGYRIFAQDNGAGKTQLMVIFASGAAQQIAIEP